MIKISELEEKDIINTTDGRCLGALMDIEIDLNTGRVRNLVLAGTGRRKRDEMTISWQEIKKIGYDTILVKAFSRELPSYLLEEHYD